MAQKVCRTCHFVPLPWTLSEPQIYDSSSFVITGLVEFRLAQNCDCAKLERRHLRRS